MKKSEILKELKMYREYLLQVKNNSLEKQKVKVKEYKRN